MIHSGATPLFIASLNGHLDVVRKLLANPQKNTYKAHLHSGASPLFMASLNGHTGVVKELLSDPQINVNQVFICGYARSFFVTFTCPFKDAILTLIFGWNLAIYFSEMRFQ